MRNLLHVIPIALAVCAAPALAVTEGVTSQGRPFVSGGITTDERDSLSAARPEDGVRIVTVAREGGVYLADARISIADDSGHRVLDTRLDGPWLDVQLAPGRYVIDAEFERQSLSRPLVVGDARRDVYFAFDTDADSIPGASGG